jgi:hypothetical protein
MHMTSHFVFCDSIPVPPRSICWFSFKNMKSLHLPLEFYNVNYTITFVTLVTK